MPRSGSTTSGTSPRGGSPPPPAPRRRSRTTACASTTPAATGTTRRSTGRAGKSWNRTPPRRPSVADGARHRLHAVRGELAPLRGAAAAGVPGAPDDAPAVEQHLVRGAGAEQHPAVHRRDPASHRRLRAAARGHRAGGGHGSARSLDLADGRIAVLTFLWGANALGCW